MQALNALLNYINTASFSGLYSNHRSLNYYCYIFKVLENNLIDCLNMYILYTFSNTYIALTF